MPGWPGFAVHADDAVRLLRALVRPVLVVIAIAVVTAALLLGGRSLAPFVIGGGIGGPAQMAGLSGEETRAERELRAEAERLLQSFDAAPPESSNAELP